MSMTKKPMIVRCKTTGQLIELPCPASGCPLFGDCLAEYEKGQMTNADRIRAMSDEELAQVLSSNCTYREFCHGCVAEKDMPNCPEDSIKKWTEWLKQPAEEN